MDIGRIGVFIGLGASTLAVLLYALSLRGRRKVLWAARIAFALTAASVVFCFGRLMWLVVNHKFQYEYVFNYSSADLSFPWNYAATWAGQEGSFLLWMFWTALIGGLVAWKAGPWESRVMPFYISVLVFLFAILTWLNPYRVIPRGTGQFDWPLDLPYPPMDGKGLHPSLQNYWMAIHPPTIFFGFVSLAVPFCYAVAAMLWREYETWAVRVMPWTLMAVATLGLGLFMGGYWAYETQGWHGFWAWDPVENASLFPWLACLGLLHGLIVQKSRGGMGRTNLFLAILAWVLFLYGTFLTRSGVLSNFSVHSFVSLASTALILLIVMIAVYGLGGLALLAVRWRGIPGRPISDRMLSRDTAMVLAVTLMIAGTVIIALGTSWPMISQWKILKSIPFLASLYAEKGMAAQPIFYNRIGSALIIPALIIMGMVPFLAWGKTDLEKFLWKILVPWFAALGGGFLIVWFILHEATHGVSIDSDNVITTGFHPSTPRMLIVAIGTLGLFAAFANIALAVKLLRVKAVTMGGWLAHVGIGLLFVGTIITNVYEKTYTVVLIEGEQPVRTPFGYALQFAGWTHDEKTERARQTADPQLRAKLEAEIARDWYSFDHGVLIRVSRTAGGAGAAHADDADPHGEADSHVHAEAGGEVETKDGFLAHVRVFHSRSLDSARMLNPEQESPTTMRWPHIHKEWLRDFYIYVANDPKLLRPSAVARPGETVPIVRFDGFHAHETGYKVHYKKFYMAGNPGQSGTIMGAEMDLIMPDGRKIPIRPGKELTSAGMASVNTQIPEANAAVILDGGVDANTKQVTALFELPEAPARWAMPVSVTNKPGINLVWLGVILMGIGTFCAMARRALEARKGALIQTAVAAGIGEVPLEPVAVPGGNGKERGNGAKARPGRRARAKAGSKRSV